MLVETLSNEERHAAKSYQCYDCYRTIPKGERHHVFTGKHDGVVYNLRCHLDCFAASSDYSANGEWWDDGVPPLYDMIQDSGEFQTECDRMRGHYPHVVTRMELNEQLAEIRWADKCASRTSI